jgi:hypothetical protein
MYSLTRESGIAVVIAGFHLHARPPKARQIDCHPALEISAATKTRFSPMASGRYPDEPGQDRRLKVISRTR